MPRGAVLYYAKSLAPSLTLNLAVQFLSAAIFCSVEGWDFGSALYHCIVTATTVGYGDVYIASPSGQYFATFHMIFSVVLLAELLGTIGTVSSERAALLARVDQLQKRLDDALVTRMVATAKTLRPLVQRDGEGVTELEFALGMLVELEIVSIGQVTPFIKQFRTLDVSGIYGRRQRRGTPSELSPRQRLADSRSHLQLGLVTASCPSHHAHNCIASITTRLPSTNLVPLTLHQTHCITGDGRLGPEDLKLTKSLDPEKLRRLQRNNTQKIKRVSSLAMS